MAKWKKGDPSPNSAGRPKIPDDVKELKRLNQVEIERVLNEFLQLTPQQLKKKKEDPEATMLELLVISIITHGANKGDHQRFNFLLDRLVGKMKENLNLSGDLSIRPYRDLSDHELEERIKKLEDVKGT